MKLSWAAATAAMVVMTTTLSQCANAEHVYSAEEIQRLRGKKCTNLDEVKASVGFTNIYKDPYPKLWYDTTIDYGRNCYVVYPSLEDRSTYELKTMTAEEVEAYAPGRHFYTHSNGCGMCSQLDDLATYIFHRDLTTPVRRCTLRMVKPWTISCLASLGFTEECKMIWFYNTANTKKTEANGGCFGVCVAHIFSPNNIPVGNYNPCKPPAELLDREMTGGALEDEGASLNRAEISVEVPGRELCLPCRDIGWCKSMCLPKSAKADGALCRNTINGRPACGRQQWENNEYRMNPCLQCDECRSGPIFQKIAGRTRRNSGVISAISRPGVQEVIHNYG